MPRAQARQAWHTQFGSSCLLGSVGAGDPLGGALHLVLVLRGSIDHPVHSLVEWSSLNRRRVCHFQERGGVLAVPLGGGPAGSRTPACESRPKVCAAKFHLFLPCRDTCRHSVNAVPQAPSKRKPCQNCRSLQSRWQVLAQATHAMFGKICKQFGSSQPARPGVTHHKKTAHRVVELALKATHRG